MSEDEMCGIAFAYGMLLEENERYRAAIRLGRKYARKLKEAMGWHSTGLIGDPAPPPIPDRCFYCHGELIPSEYIAFGRCLNCALAGQQRR